MSVDTSNFTTANSSSKLTKSPKRLRVVTYNVHGESAQVITDAFRRSDVLRRAHIILLQEIEHHDGENGSRPRQIARTFNMSYAYAPGYRVGKRGSHGVAILSRFPLTDLKIHQLPRYRVHVNSARRVAIAATVRAHGHRVRIYSVHLDNRINPSERRAQLAPVLDAAVAQPIQRVIIGGDFNTSPFCWISHMVPVPCGIQATRLERYVRGRGFDTPVIASGGTSKWLAMRLDGIYTRGLDSAGFDVEDGVRLSDHLPLWVDLDLNQAARTKAAQTKAPSSASQAPEVPHHRHKRQSQSYSVGSRMLISTSAPTMNETETNK